MNRRRRKIELAGNLSGSEPAPPPQLQDSFYRLGAVFVGIKRGRLDRSLIPAMPSARYLAAHLCAVTGETMNIFAATTAAQ